MVTTSGEDHHSTTTGSAVVVNLKPDHFIQLLDSSRPIVIQLEMPRKDLLDFSIYAPTIPGVLVALVGLIIAHQLSLARDRRKELRDLCTELKKLADDAATSAMATWQMPKSDDRQKAVNETKRMLQAVGIAATHLNRRQKSIDLASQVYELRRAATTDPFEDPDREAAAHQIGPIMAVLAELIHSIETGYSKVYT